MEIILRYRAEQFLVHTCMAEVKQAGADRTCGKKIAPHRQTVRFAMCEIFAFRKGLIARKDSYVDGLGYLAAMRAA